MRTWDPPICAEQRDSVKAIFHVAHVCGFESNPFIHFGKHKTQGAGAAPSVKSINYTWNRAWRREEAPKSHLAAIPEQN